MKPRNERMLRCAIYTRKSSEEGLEQDFNSLHAQREACEAYIRSQQGEGWRLHKASYDDGGLSGGTMERPALKQLLADIEEGLGATGGDLLGGEIAADQMFALRPGLDTAAPRTPIDGLYLGGASAAAGVFGACAAGAIAATAMIGDLKAGRHK